jgi:tRNA(Ile2) C34 agmatinyltransferase TiaS
VKEQPMNPHWTQIVYGTVKRLVKTCPHCGKRALYEQKSKGQFYTCKRCRHRFRENEQ